MIGQIDIEKSLLNAPNDRSLFVAVASVVNSLVDAINELQHDNSEKANCQENVQDELKRTRKALDVALDWLGQVATPEKCDDDLCREFTKRKLAEIENITKGGDNE